MRLPTLAAAFLGLIMAATQGRCLAATPDTDVVPNRLIVVYRAASVPSGDAPGVAGSAVASRTHIALQIPNWGLSVLQIDNASAAEIRTLQSRIAADPTVAYVVHDRNIQANRIVTAPVPAAALAQAAKSPSTPDWFYTSTPQGWAVKQVGGYGAGAPGGPATGPWNASTGRGVRIAILDSGISSTHPDTAPNLVYAQTLVDQSAVPSPCDDGSPEDQAGHGTFTASLAAAAAGRGTGMVVGVAPRASLLNIKVLQRVPAANGASLVSQCEQGPASGLMSWMIAGIAAASQQHADVISISAGGLLDSYSGEAEGIVAAVNRAVYNATQAGALVIAAAGNDGESLDNNRYIEMPAQAEDALAVVATTNSRCAQDLSANATCQPGPPALPYYSNYGSTIAAVAAPGGSYPQDAGGTGVSGFVRGACSTGLRDSREGLPAQSGHSFACFSLGHQAYVEAIGTSASAPLVAGVAALLKGAQPTLTPAQIASALRAGAATDAAGTAAVHANQVDAAAALRSLGITY